jgi:hypothetical protein
MESFFNKIESEINNYTTQEVDISDGVKFSQYKLVKRIALYQNQIYPKGKVDSQGDYKYWFDIINPRVNSEIKNIDFDTKDITIYSNSIKDSLAVFLSNLELSKWLKDNNKGEELNDNVEDFSSWGNVVWKKVKDGYEAVDLKNFYVLNQSAKTLDESDVIERHLLTQSELREKSGIYKNVEEVIKTCGNKFFSKTEKSGKIDSSSPFYEVYERNGEISEKELKELNGEQGGKEDKYVLAKVIIAGLRKGEKGGKFVLFAEKIDKKPYKEAHRGKYRGRWFREGLYETLFDCQTRANQIGNNLAKGLEWASRTIFRTSDTLIIQNTLTDMRSGDIIKAKELAQVEVRMQGFDQLVADWNRNIQVANDLANSFEVVSGESMPSGTPFRLGALMNQNANKLFDFLREKLAISLSDLIDEWILPVLMKNIRGKEVIELTGDEKYLKEYYKMVAKAWYLNNLLLMPPHSTEEGEMIIKLKEEEISRNKEALIKIEKGFWDSFKPRIRVIISGENVNLLSELESLYSFIKLEADPVRRTALIEMAMQKKGIDITTLPKSPPQPIQAPQEVRQPQNQGQPVLTT